MKKHQMFFGMNIFCCMISFFVGGDLLAYMYSWPSLEEQSNGTWISTNALGTQVLTYIAAQGGSSYLNVQGASDDESFSLNLRKGSWSWGEALYDAPTYTWTDEVSEAQWTYDPFLGKWSNVLGDGEWVMSSGDDRVWRNLDNDVIWVYSAANGAWADSQHDAVWAYSVTEREWVKVSGGGPSSLGDDQYPPLALLQQRYVFDALYALMQTSNLFPQVAHERDFARDEEDSGIFLSAHDEAAIRVDFWRAASPTVLFNQAAGAISFTFHPDSGSWSWENGSVDPVLEWSYDSESKTWAPSTGPDSAWELTPSIDNSAVGTWVEVDGDGVWVFNSLLNTWYDATNDVVWMYDPITRAWNEKSHGASLRYSDILGEWFTTAAGSSHILTPYPPAVVRQLALIRDVVGSALKAGVISFSHSVIIDFTNQGRGVWGGFNGSQDLCALFDSSLADNQLSLFNHVENQTTWPVSRLGLSISTSGSWRWTNLVNPAQPETFSYDAGSAIWRDSFHSGTEYWHYSAIESAWVSSATSSGSWFYNSYNPSIHAWHSSRTGCIWSYTVTTNRWSTDEHEGAAWYYDIAADKWTEATATGFVPVGGFPPRVLGQSMLKESLWRQLIQAPALQNSPVNSWDPVSFSWQGDDEDGNGTAFYDVRAVYPYMWKDAAGRNRAKYDNVTPAWQWVFDDTVWTYSSRTNQWVSSGGSAGERWYYRLGDNPSWEFVASGGSITKWQQGDLETDWTDMTNDAVWVYDPDHALWTGDFGTWGYNFATGAWYEDSDLGLVPPSMPPLPLVQQRFLRSIVDNADTFFQQPAYLGARAAVSNAFDYYHPLYGQRPLTKDRSYERYNTSSMLVNAPIHLQNVWLVHNDVARNLGRTQVPGITTAALPAIVGGERAALVGDPLPTISLYNSRIACHESLVSAGVRFVVQENDAFDSDGSGMSDNLSKIVLYGRGRSLDAPLRRGPVFQLGSTANRMADGTLTESLVTLRPGAPVVSSLRDAFLNIYRSRDAYDATPAASTLIELDLFSAKEAGVPSSHRATNLLFLAHGSYIDIGWPTAVGSAGYRPWTIPLAGVDSYDEDSFDTALCGGGLLNLASSSWCIGARRTDNTAAATPVTKNGAAGVLFVDYGGVISSNDAVDLTLDTTMAVRLGYDAHAGSCTIPSDQINLAQSGKLQGYGLDFTSGGIASGNLEGNIQVSGANAIFAAGRPLQSTQLHPIKSKKERRKRQKPLGHR